MHLRAWGITPQKPVRRAYERNDAATTRWLTTEYPAVAAQARRERATIYWADEMDVRSDHVTGTRYAPAGETPVVRATGQRFGYTVISAITNKGSLAFRVFHGRFTTAVFGDFLKRLLQQAPGERSSSSTGTRYTAPAASRRSSPNTRHVCASCRCRATAPS